MDRIIMRGQQRRHLGVDLLHARVGVAGIEAPEHRIDPVEKRTGALERDDGVGEGRRCGVVRDRRDFAQLRAHAGPVGGQVMLVADLIEGRQTKGQPAGLGKGVVGHGVLVHGRVALGPRGCAG